MLPRSPFKIRKLIPQKKVEDQEDYEGSYFHHDDDDEMDTLTKIKTWRPPKGLMKRSKPSIDIRKSEDLHRIICMPPSPYTPQSSTSSLCSIENNGASNFGTSPRSSPPRRPDRSTLEPSPQRSPQRSPLLIPQQMEESHRLRPRGRSPVSAYYFSQLTPPSSPPQHAEMFPEPPVIHHEILKETPSPAPTPAQATSNEATPPLEPAAEITASSSLSQPEKVKLHDVQKLINETEEAFKELPSFTKLSEPQLAKFPLPKQPAPLSPLTRRKSSRRSQGSVRSSKSVRSVKSPTKAGVTKIPLSPAPPRLPANARPAVRPKRAKSKKARRRPAAPVRQSSMWQLAESAKEFAIQIGLHRVEVDEMLPESTLREIRMSRAAQWTKSPELGVTHVDSRKDSTASATTTTSTTSASIEPLSLDETTITADGVATPRASVINKAAEVDREDCRTPKAQGIQLQIPDQKDGAEQGAERGHSPTPQPDSPTAGHRNEDDDGEDGLPIMMMVEDDLPAPSPRVKSMGPPSSSSSGGPSKPPMHRRFPSAPLPTIPEITATTPTTPQTITPPPPPPAPVPVRPDSDEYIYLDSTAFTMTMPVFKHGPIRLAKADLPIGKLAAAVDDTLDWTAFQMAIIGGAGDFFSEPTDYSRPSEAELDDLDEIYTWFESFGFESVGGLVTARQRPTTKTLTAKPTSPPRTPGLAPGSGPGPMKSPGVVVRIDPPPTEPAFSSGPGAGLEDSIAGRVLAPPPSTYKKGHRRSVSSGTFSIAGESQPSDQPAPTNNDNNTNINNKNHKNLAIDSVASQQQLRRPSTDSMMSLPQSPMMELVLTHDIHGEEVPVPMGCNMSHDARDFLFWHTENVISYGSSTGEGRGGRAELI